MATVPTPPIEFGEPDGEVTARWDVDELSSQAIKSISGACPVSFDEGDRAEHGRDWWPIGIAWALRNEVGAAPDLVARPTTTGQVARLLVACNKNFIPVTPAAGRSSVVGGAVPVHGGVSLDMCDMRGITSMDATSMLITVAAGTFGNDLEAELRSTHQMTLGHWPQSMDLSTVGGWLACRSAGQFSTRYGKIEDMVAGLTVVLADGTIVRTGGHSRASAGPDLTQLFVGSEGTLGVITEATLRVHPLPVYDARAAYAFTNFADGLDACRAILQRGARPAVLRLYDDIEGQRNFGTGDAHVLLVFDEGDQVVVDAYMAIVASQAAARSAAKLSADLVTGWLGHRNDVSALAALTRKGFVVDTLETTGNWRDLPTIFDAVRAAILNVPHARAATCHQSHAYTDGACLYFTFAGTPPADERDAFYRDVWDAGTAAALRAGANLSHHHGVGLNRARFMRTAIGTGLDVLDSVKYALDENGIMNPGKLGLADAFGSIHDPAISR